MTDTPNESERRPREWTIVGSKEKMTGDRGFLGPCMLVVSGPQQLDFDSKPTGFGSPFFRTPEIKVIEMSAYLKLESELAAEKERSRKLVRILRLIESCGKCSSCYDLAKVYANSYEAESKK